MLLQVLFLPNGTPMQDARCPAPLLSWGDRHHVCMAPDVTRRDFPGGSGGGFVDGAGFSKTTRQRASDLLFSDATLNR